MTLVLPLSSAALPIRRAYAALGDAAGVVKACADVVDAFADGAVGSQFGE